MRKLRDEVDEVIGNEIPTVAHLSKLPYLTGGSSLTLSPNFDQLTFSAVIRETMRLQPPATARTVTSLEDTTIGGGKYAIKAGTPLVVQNWVAGKDPKVFGEDAWEFKPERMLDGKFEALPPNAWQPFGNGVRACIGRGFALQEMTVSLVSFF